MQVGSIIAYDCDPAKIGEVIKISVCSINHETFLKIKPFGNSEMIYRYKCEVWLLADNL
jgi:hypothetical protein